MHFFCLKCFFPRCMLLVPCCMPCFSHLRRIPPIEKIAKELQVCLDRSAAGGEALEYRNHAFQDERSLHSEKRFTWIPGCWFQTCFKNSSLLLGNDPIWLTFFTWVVQPPPRFTIITRNFQVSRGDLWRSRHLWREVPWPNTTKVTKKNTFPMLHVWNIYKHLFTINLSQML